MGMGLDRFGKGNLFLRQKLTHCSYFHNRLKSISRIKNPEFQFEVFQATSRSDNASLSNRLRQAHEFGRLSNNGRSSRCNRRENEPVFAGKEGDVEHDLTQKPPPRHNPISLQQIYRAYTDNAFSLRRLSVVEHFFHVRIDVTFKSGRYVASPPGSLIFSRQIV